MHYSTYEAGFEFGQLGGSLRGGMLCVLGADPSRGLNMRAPCQCVLSKQAASILNHSC